MDWVENPELTEEALFCWVDPSRVSTLSPELWAEIKPRVERQHRLWAKRDKIEAEKEAFFAKREEESRKRNMWPKETNPLLEDTTPQVSL
jgi:hypothetical protein